MTIPRLELEAVVQGIKLATTAMADLDIPLQHVFTWSDSSAALGWVKNDPGHLPVYVSNRVKKIVNVVPATPWHYVAMSANPANCLSRGIEPADLKASTLWWSGQPWLSLPQEQWPRHQRIDLK